MTLLGVCALLHAACAPAILAAAQRMVPTAAPVASATEIQALVRSTTSAGAPANSTDSGVPGSAQGPLPLVEAQDEASSAGGLANTLTSFGRWFLPVTDSQDDGVRMDRLVGTGPGAGRRMERREGRRDGRRGSSSGGSSNSSGSAHSSFAPPSADSAVAPSSSTSTCARIKDVVLGALQSALRGSLEWTVQV